MGIQLYSIRDFMEKNPVDTLKRVAALGYEELETYGYDVAKGTYYGHKASDFKTILDDLNLSASSGLYGFSDYLKTSGEFSITAKTSWYLNHLHPEIANVTHEIIFPAFLVSTKHQNLYISDYNVQTYSVEAPNRLSSAKLTKQQIVNYLHYYKYSVENIFSLLNFKSKLIYVNKFFIYNRLNGSRLTLKVDLFYKLFNVIYFLIPRFILLNFVKRMRK